MQNPTFLFQFLIGIVAGLGLHFALYDIGQLLRVSSTTLYLHNFFIIALLSNLIHLIFVMVYIFR